MEMQLYAPVVDAVSGDGERELVERAKWDREAFAVLYRRYYPIISRYVRRRVGDQHTADDLVAEVFLTVLRVLPKYRHRGLPVRAWLYRIAGNTVNRWARKRSRNPVSRLPADLAAAETNTTADNQKELARQALLSVAPKYQTVLALHYLEGMGIAEVASAVGCRVGTVKSRLWRGRNALRERLLQQR